jgi:hypothetical protein
MILLYLIFSMALIQAKKEKFKDKLLILDGFQKVDMEKFQDSF